MHGSTRQLKNSGEGGSSSPLYLLDATSPVPTHISLMVFITVLFVLRGGGKGEGGKPLPKLSHNFVQTLAPDEDNIYKTGQELIVVNHFYPHRSCGRSQCRHTR